MPPYFYKQENYFMKMKSDTNFFSESSLTQYFNFSQKPDPFLLNLKEIDNDQSKIVHYISKNLLKRI